MNENFTLVISWEFFLSIVGSLILIAFYTGGRFSKIESSIEWMKDKINDIKTGQDNESAKAFQSTSPVSLTEKGSRLLNESGIKEYIESNEEKLIEICELLKGTNSYEVQKFVFSYFNKLDFGDIFDKKIKSYAYDQGVSTDIIRRVGAIFFRDICLYKFEMKIEDIDKNNTRQML